MEETKEEREMRAKINKIAKFIKGIDTELLWWALNRMVYEAEKRG